MRYQTLVFAALVQAGLLDAAPPSASGSQQHVLGGSDFEAEAFKCDLPPVVSPSSDGLPSAAELFSSKAAFMKQVERHSAIVQVPSISYDDLGEVDEDPRWLVFFDFHKVLEELFPTVHSRMTLEKVNRFGLVYTLEGSDPSLRPIMLTAHQDVVPVADPSTWTHPPFSAYFDGTWLWGRGASDDKNSLTGLMSAMETLLSNPDWSPTRTIVMAFGFDEECSGKRGAGTIGPYLEKKFGKNSMVLILDEGGMGLQQIDKTLYALPAVMEKGHIDVWYELHVTGGHSSTPFPHTGIGIMAEIVQTLEANPYEPKMIEGSPIHNHFVCQARYSPEAEPTITELVKKGDLKALTAKLVTVDRATNFRLQTSQSVDIIGGGQKINAMPEVIKLGVNYRVAPHNSIAEIQQRTVELIKPILKKYGVALTAFEGEGSAAAVVEPLYEVDYNGSLVLTSSQRTQPAPLSPISGPVWDLFSGTIQHTFAFDGTVVPVGELMTGNTDTRHYLDLTPNVYRWVPTRQSSGENIHTINEKINMNAHMEAVRFYYDLIRNFDASKV